MQYIFNKCKNAKYIIIFNKFCKQLKMNNLFWPDENSTEQCFAAHIVKGCQQYCSTLLHLMAG